MIKQNLSKHVNFSFFNPLKVTGELEIECSGWVHGIHGGELGGGELAMGRNRYHSVYLYPKSIATEHVITTDE